jgi:hypothetical protein
MAEANGNGKADKFRTLATRRVSKTMNNIRQIGRLSRRSSYDYAPEQVGKMFAALRAELDAAEAKFGPQVKPQPALFEL